MKKRKLLPTKDEEISWAFGNTLILLHSQTGISEEMEYLGQLIFERKWEVLFENSTMIAGLKILSIWKGTDKTEIESRRILFKYFFNEMKLIQDQTKNEREILFPGIKPDPALFIPIPFHSKY